MQSAKWKGQSGDEYIIEKSDDNFLSLIAMLPMALTNHYALLEAMNVKINY